MRLVPGMLVKYKVHTAKVIFYLDEISVWFQDMDDKSVFMAAAPDVWIPTGEVDWSLVPDGTEIEFELWDTPKYTQGTKLGSRDTEVFVLFSGTPQWIKNKNVRIPQQEPEIKEKPVIDFEDDPPKPGDLYLIEQGKEVMFLCIDDEPGIETKWIWRLRNKPHYAFNSNRYGVVVSSLLENYNLISRKPVRHKEKFWVQIYPLRTNEVYLRVWDITDKNKFKPDEDCLACKVIEIEWTEGEGL